MGGEGGVERGGNGAGGAADAGQAGAGQAGETDAGAGGNTQGGAGGVGETNDCRTTGCDQGSTCEECHGPDGAVFGCVPNGAAC
jgi:hypothetical protein